MTLRLPILLTLTLLVACGGDGGGDPGPTGPQPGFSFSVTPNTLTVVVGESGDYTVSVGRTGGFDGPVSVSINQLPSGATAEPVTIDAGQSSATLTVTIRPGSNPGVFTLTLRATAAGLDARSTEATLVTRIVA